MFIEHRVTCYNGDNDNNDHDNDNDDGDDDDDDDDKNIMMTTNGTYGLFNG